MLSQKLNKYVVVDATFEDLAPCYDGGISRENMT